MWGSRAKKPTSLLAVDLPELAEAIAPSPNSGRCSHSAHRAAYGRDAETGGLRTSPLKQYPESLCRLFAGCIAQHWQDHIGHNWEPWPLPDSLAPFYVPRDPFYDFTMGADFALGARLQD